MNIILILVLSIVSTKCNETINERARNFSLVFIYREALQTRGHAVVGSLGIWNLMTTVTVGTDGKSFEELRKAFRSKTKPRLQIDSYKSLNSHVISVSRDVSLISSNYIFLDDEFAVDSIFRRRAVEDFEAAVEVLNFDEPAVAVSAANNYISDSESKLLNVLTLDNFIDSRMVLINVLSFRGFWRYPFDERETKIQPFYDERGAAIGEVNMMYQRNKFPFADVKQIGAYALELPYGREGKFSFLILLPSPGKTVADVYKAVTIMGMQTIFDRLDKDVNKYELEDIDVRIPRFKISNNFELNRALIGKTDNSTQVTKDSIYTIVTIHREDKQLGNKSYIPWFSNRPLHDLGVRNIFEPRYANFSRLSKERVFASRISHNAVLEVNESGSVASNPTTAYVTGRINTPGYIANKPFIYFIIEKTATAIVLGGIYNTPT